MFFIKWNCFAGPVLAAAVSRRPVVDPYGVVETPPQSAGPPTRHSRIAESFDSNGMTTLGHKIR